MQLVKKLELSSTSTDVLNAPPPLERHHWAEYRHLVGLLSDQHTAIIQLLMDDDLNRGKLGFYETDQAQDLLDTLFVRGSGYLMMLDRDIKRLIEKGGSSLSGYLMALTLMRENLTNTIKYYHHIKGAR